MQNQTLEVRPASLPGRVLTIDGRVLTVPATWILVPPGDAALSRRLKLAGPCWVVSELKGRKRFSRGIWTCAHTVSALKAELQVERADPAHEKKLLAGRRRRAAQEVEYADEFRASVLAYLSFHARHEPLALRLATAIAAHATPVGSGTVARTERIPLEERAEAATIAWLRHQTTGYDDMVIPRVRGQRREVRRLLARRSVQLLARYRTGEAIPPALCPLTQALPKEAPVPAPH